MPQRSILFTSSFTSTFILDDLTFLRRRFVVEHLLTRGPRALIGICRGVLHNDVTFTWFASLYAVVVVAVARLMGKPSYLIVGGADVMHVDGLEYGPWRSPLKRLLIGWAIRNATAVLPVADALRTAALRLADSDGANMKVVPTGYDSSYWVPAGVKQRSVLSLAGCESRARLLVKGVDLLFAVARTLPDEQFILVGTRPGMIGQLGVAVPPNVRVLPPVSRAELPALYQASRVYLQPSRSEGLPNAVCEAMLCGCIPVGTNVGGMPGAIGTAGFVVPPDDVAALAGAIRRALDLPDERGVQARQHIISHFPVERREGELGRLLSGGDS